MASLASVFPIKKNGTAPSGTRLLHDVAPVEALIKDGEPRVVERGEQRRVRELGHRILLVQDTRRKPASVVCASF